MKKLLIPFLAYILFASTQAQAQKFGYCNSALILSEMPEVKQADSDLKAFQTQLQKRGQEMVKDLQAKAAALQDKQDKGLISPKNYQTQAEELKKEEEAIGAYEQEMYTKLSEKREQLYTPILNRVNNAMKEAAIENGFMYVFDLTSQALLYSDESLDVSQLVREKLAASKSGE
ncbi:MAG: OmpH family outer membrane protein [Saprospiraceae bacterium]